MECKNINIKYFNYLSDNRINIIGPGFSQFDKIIKLPNSKIVTMNANKDFIDFCKPDIVYFNNKRAREHPEQVINSSKICDWVILKDKFFFDKILDKNIVTNCNNRFLNSIEHDTSLGSYNYLPIILIDLIVHGVKKIFVQNIDFFSNPVVYKKL